MARDETGGHYKIALLGGFEIQTDDGTSLLPGARKARGILIYLFMQGGAAVARDKLVDLFWPDHDLKQGRLNLRQTLFELRGALGEHTENLLDIGRQSARAITQHATINLWTKEGGYRLDSLLELCEGLGQIADEFDVWLEQERRSVRSAQVRAIEAQLQNPQTAPSRVIALAERLLAAEPENELAARAAMWTHWNRGQGSHAVRIFETLQRDLEAEGYEMSPETLELKKRIDTSEPDTDHPAKSRPPTVAILPLTGYGAIEGARTDLFNATLRARMGAVRELSARPVETTADDELTENTYILSGTLASEEGKVRCQVTVTGGVGGDMLQQIQLWGDEANWLGAAEGLVDEIVARVLPAIENREAKAAGNSREPETWYRTYARAKTLLNTATGPEHGVQAERYLRRVIELHEDFVPAYPLLISLVNSRWRSTQPGSDPQDHRDEALELAKRALVLDARYPNTLIAMTWVMIRRQEFDRAEKFLNDAVAERPYEASRVNSIGSAFVVLGDHPQAADWFARAAQIAHHDMDYQYTDLAELHYFKGDYAAALSYLNIGQMRNPAYSRCLRAATLAQLGDLAEAKREAQAVIEIFRERWNSDEPFSVEAATRWFVADFPMRREIDTRNLVEGLIKAGFRL